MEPDEDTSNDILTKKISEYSLAVVKDRPNFHISLVIDISPCCDCHAENDAPVVPDVGIFASFDPVALDMACADAVNAQPVMAGSVLAEKEEHHTVSDHMHAMHPTTDWKVGLVHAQKLGIGSMEYELIEVK